MNFLKSDNDVGAANALGIIIPITQTKRTERSRYLILLRLSSFVINLIRVILGYYSRLVN